MTRSLRSPMVARASALLSLRGGGQALEFVGWVVLARHLGTGEFGQLSIAFFAARALGLVADWGATVQGARDVAAGRDPAALHALARWRLLLGTALAVGYAVVVVALGQPSLAPLALCVFGRGLARDWLALGAEKSARSSVPAFTQGTIVALGAALCSTVAGASAVIGAAYVGAAILSIALNRMPGGGKSRVRPTAGWFFLVSLAEQIFLTSDAFLVAWLMGSDEAGIYSAIYRFPNAWMTVMGLVVLSAVPAVTRHLTHEPHALAALRRQALRIGVRLAVLVLVTIPVLVISVPWIFGEEYTNGRASLCILLTSTAVMAAGAGLAPLYYATRSERRLAAWTIGTAMFNVALNLALIPTFGLTGAAVSTLLAQCALTGYLLVATRTTRVTV